MSNLEFSPIQNFLEEHQDEILREWNEKQNMSSTGLEELEHISHLKSYSFHEVIEAEQTGLCNVRFNRTDPYSISPGSYLGTLEVEIYGDTEGSTPIIGFQVRANIDQEADLTEVIFESDSKLKYDGTLSSSELSRRVNEHYS